ncbi:MAG: LamG domain-containing protein, partial [Actinomycetota bacterium]|nr:LamG domain-containing protein [Actinomycetota bacterium]
MVDASGGANPGELQDALGRTAVDDGRTGAGVRFPDGAAATAAKYVRGARPAVPTDESFTVSAWVYLTDGTAHRTAVSQRGTNQSGFYLKHAPTGSGSRWEFLFTLSDPATTQDSDYVFAQSTSAAATNTWVHLAGVYDDEADLIRLYVNGVQEATNGKTLEWDAKGPFEVGRSFYNGSPVDPWSGRIDDVRAYPRALTADEVGAIFDAPVTQWEMDRGAGTTIPDHSGGNPGTLYNGDTAAVSGPGWTNGQTGGALGFDGTDDHVVGRTNAVRTDRSFTASAWVNLSSTTGHRVAVSMPGTRSSAFFLKYDPGTTPARFSFMMTQTDADNP